MLYSNKKEYICVCVCVSNFLKRATSLAHCSFEEMESTCTCRVCVNNLFPHKMH